MQLNKLIDLYQRNKLSHEEQKQATDFVTDMNSQVDLDIDKIDEKILDSIIEHMVKEELNNVTNFVILMRYFKVIGRDDLYIHLTKYTGMLGVVDNIVARLKRIIGKEKALEILEGYDLPYLGVSPYRLPDYTAELMNRLESALDEETVKLVVTGNNHGIPKEAMLSEKVEYENAATLEEYLVGRHKRKVAELQEHYEQDKIWYEQKITKEVVDFVKSNQEVLSAVLKDEKLYITKIPYDPDNYLKTDDLKLRQYYACHCPMAREAVKSGSPKISRNFCYCSAGFAKFPFEVILDQKLNITCLENVFDGSDKCRFVIDLKDVDYKK